MVAVERALARARGAPAGVTRRRSAASIAAALDGLPSSTRRRSRPGRFGEGVPVPALVAALRKARRPTPGQWLHWGATSQDIVEWGSPCA